MEKNSGHNNHMEKNGQQNQIQQINDLSRFGHSVTLCKMNILIFYSKF